MGTRFSGDLIDDDNDLILAKIGWLQLLPSMRAGHAQISASTAVRNECGSRKRKAQTSQWTEFNLRQTSLTRPRKISSQSYSCAFPTDSALQHCKTTFCSQLSNLTPREYCASQCSCLHLQLTGALGCLAGGDSDVGVLLYQGALLQLTDHSEGPASALK